MRLVLAVLLGSLCVLTTHAQHSNNNSGVNKSLLDAISSLSDKELAQLLKARARQRLALQRQGSSKTTGVIQNQRVEQNTIPQSGQSLTQVADSSERQDSSQTVNNNNRPRQTKFINTNNQRVNSIQTDSRRNNNNNQLNSQNDFRNQQTRVSNNNGRRPQSGSSFQQNRPVTSNQQSRPVGISNQQSRPANNNRPQSRPVNTQSRPTSTQSRPTSTQSRPANTQSRPTSTQSRPTNVQSRPANTNSQSRPASNNVQSQQKPSSSSSQSSDKKQGSKKDDGQVLALPVFEKCEERSKFFTPKLRYGKHNYFYTADFPEFRYLDKDGKDVMRKFNWLEARNLCRQYCMDSVGMESRGENDFVFNWMENENITYIWTSGRICDFTGCEARKDLFPIEVFGWFWSDTYTKMAPTNSTPTNWGYQPWSNTGHTGAPQPDNAEFDINQTSESCMGVLQNVYDDGVKWHDIACYHKKPALCEENDVLLKYHREVKAFKAANGEV